MTVGLTRREALLLGGGIAAGAVGAGWWLRGRGPGPIPPARPGIAAGARYGHGVMPPEALGPLALDGATWPPPPDPRPAPVTRRYSMAVVDQRVPVSADQSLAAWTFGGSIPGPILRANEGDTLEIVLENRGARPHNLHFHGRHQVGADGWEPVPPGGTVSYRLTAGPSGLHPYHCDFTPAEDHVGNGLYGLLIVDPRRPRPAAREVALVLGGFDADGDGRSELFGWNGVAGFYAKHPIKVPAGELIRVYLANMVTDRPLGSFHLHSEVFAVYRDGAGSAPERRTDVLVLGPAERAMLEFRLPARGRYMFHPHHRDLAEGGAMGWFAAT